MTLLSHRLIQIWKYKHVIQRIWKKKLNLFLYLIPVNIKFYLLRITYLYLNKNEQPNDNIYPNLITFFCFNKVTIKNQFTQACFKKVFLLHFIQYYGFIDVRWIPVFLDLQSFHDVLNKVFAKYTTLVAKECQQNQSINPPIPFGWYAS